MTVSERVAALFISSLVTTGSFVYLASLVLPQPILLYISSYNYLKYLSYIHTKI